MKFDSAQYLCDDSINDHRFSKWNFTLYLKPYMGKNMIPNSIYRRSVENRNFYIQSVRKSIISKTVLTDPASPHIDDTYEYVSQNLYMHGPVDDDGLTSMTEKTQDLTNLNNAIEGVPAQFINSFGNFLGLKYFLNGIQENKDVHTHIDKHISPTDFDKIKSKFTQCRFIHRGTVTEYEFYNESYGYIVINHDKLTSGRYTIICAIGYDEMHNLLETTGKDIITSPMASWVTGIDSYGELNIKNFSLQSIHPYEPAFYPFMNNEDIRDFAKRYVESNSSILLLIGPPGTAKTNFIRQLLQVTNESVLLTYSDDLKKTDKLFSYFYDSPEKFLIIEDADTYIEKREDGNTNMKQVLNITDGLTANPSKKVIFSTNLPSLTRVEPALLRPGRCFEKLQFGRLTGDELDAAMDVIGYDHFKYTRVPQNGLTIAELFAIKNNEPIDIAESTPSFGFKK